MTDILPSINYEKSIEKQRLVYNKTGSYLLNIVFIYVNAALYILIGTVPLLALIAGSNIPVWLVFCSLIFVTWMLANIAAKDVFIKIEGKGNKENRESILKALNSFYDDLYIQINSEKMIWSLKPTGRPFWGRMITIVFDNNIILLNITKLGKDQSPTFVHSFFNYLEAKKIKNYYVKHLSQEQP